MGIEMLLTSIFFAPGEDIPLYGNSEMIERGRLHQKANDVGTSRFQTFLTDPQPGFDLEVKGRNTYFSQQTVNRAPVGNSMSYSNSSYKPLGGIVNINPEEFQYLMDTVLNDISK